MKRLAVLGIIVISVVIATACGDTFVSRKTGQVLHGWAEFAETGKPTVLHTKELGKVQAPIEDYTVERNAEGRSGHVAVLRINQGMDLEMEAEAFEEALVSEANKGPRFILIELDTPGGRVDLMMRYCNALTKLSTCETVVYICGGPNGGAYSAGSAVALAADRVYMAPGTAVGGAESIIITADGEVGDPKAMFGEVVAEKMSSITRNFFASLAQRKSRPDMLAKAMENRDVAVVEILESGKRRFIDPVDRKPGQRIEKTWSSKGRLLTLPAEDAVDCGIADGVAASRADVLTAMDADGATLQVNRKPQEARELYDKLVKRYEKLLASIDTQVTQIATAPRLNRHRALNLISGMIKDVTYLKRMKERYPDVPFDEDDLQASIAVLEALYENVRLAR